MNPCAKLLGVAGAAVIMTACAGPSRTYRADLNNQIAAGNYAGAIAQIDAAKEREYGKKNAVLYYLDRGMVQHDQGDYKGSDESLDSAERRMEELYTKSVSRGVGTFLINDNTTEYAGEAFERALMNVTRALDYLFLGVRDEALVEARKVTAWLARFNDYMQDRSGYKDSAFAQYLSAMLFEEDGKADDARISYNAASSAYGWYGGYYGTEAPSFDVPAYNDLARKGLGELVFIHYNGKAPMKVSRTMQVAWNDAMIAVNQDQEQDPEELGRFRNAVNAGVLGNAITVAYPVYVQDPYEISISRVMVDSTTVQTQLMEDVSAIARRSLEEKNAAIMGRAIARATIKFVLAKAAADEAEKQGGQAFGLLTRVVTNAVAAATEVADTRGWTTMPAQIRMARAALPPGRRDVAVTFVGRHGEVQGSCVFRDVEIVKGRRTYLHYRTAQ